MKLVVNAHQVSHFWANQTQFAAYTPSRNFSFRDRNLLSYRANIATLIPDAKCVLYNYAYVNFSHTTDTHFKLAHAAIDRQHYLHAFTVPELGVSVHKRAHELHHGHKINVQHFITLRNRQLITASRPRIRQVTRAAAREKAQQYLLVADAYCKVFKLPHSITKLLDSPAMARAYQEAEKINAAAVAREKIFAAAREKAWVESLRVKGLTPEQALAEWRACKLASMHIDQYGKLPYLRIRDDVVETSKGAGIPIEHAKRVWPILLRAKRNGTHITAEQGGGLHFGVYQSFHGFNADNSGMLVVGCHTIPWSEIEYMSAQLGLGEPA